MRWLLMLCLVLGARSGGATPPWHEGVTEEDKDAARSALLDGNLLLRHELAFLALREYDAALARWNHPALHHMRARALIAVGRPAEALAALWESRHHGGAGLTENTAETGIRLEKVLIDSELAMLVVDHDGGGQVKLGDTVLLSSRGRWVGFVAATRSALVAGARTPIPLEIRPGQRVHVQLPLEGLERVDARAVTADDIERYTETLPRPPRPLDADLFASAPRGGPDWARVDMLVPAADVARACGAPSSAHQRALCERHAREIALLRERIAVKAREFGEAARRLAMLTLGGMVETLE